MCAATEGCPSSFARQLDRTGEALHGLANDALLLRLALAVGHLRMFVSSLRMGVSLGRFLTTLRVLTLAVMFGSHLMALGGVLMVLSRFVVGVLGHVFLLARIAIYLNASTDDIVPCGSNLDAWLVSTAESPAGVRKTSAGPMPTGLSSAPTVVKVAVLVAVMAAMVIAAERRRDLFKNEVRRLLPPNLVRFDAESNDPAKPWCSGSFQSSGTI
jgi:hypothetical protein